LLAESDLLVSHKAPIELSGVSAVIAAFRNAFAEWVEENHPSLHDDLWGQYWLAGVAAGLSYCHKPALPHEGRLAGLIYAAANLKRYAGRFNLPLPTEVELLYDENPYAGASAGIAKSKRSKHNLPAQPTPFIGRSAQVAAIKELILRQDVRLITLIGPGGTGKTRLSLQVAQEALDHFPEGVFFVPLSDDTDGNQFLSRVAQQLEVRETSRHLLENLKDYLRDKQMLLVLDNFEQLVSAAPLVADFLAATSNLKMITSSRIALNLHAEHVYPVPPMELPQTEHAFKMEDLAENESVVLFVRRAQSVHPTFRLTEENGPAIAEICRRLDGLPLALELAAARVKLLPPQAILSRLDDRFKLLTGGGRDLPARQQTLRNTLEWSYGLLNEEEKALYARLSVFVGGFTLEAAEAVCNPQSQLDILEGVASLVNNSLLRQEEVTGGEPRFRMLDTIRAYALERLIENRELADLQRRHAQYYANIIINEAGYGLFGPKATYWLNRLEPEHDNIRATLAWSQAAPEGLELGPPLVAALNWFWYRRGFFNEGRRWTERVLDSPALAAPSPQKAIVLHMSGLLAMWQGDLNIAVARARQGMELVQKFEDEQSMPWSLMGTGVVLINMGKDKEAHPLLKEAQALFQEQGISYMRAITLVHLGNVALGLGDPAEAGDWLAQAHVLFREIGEEWGLSFVLNNLAEVARVQGNYDQAGRYYEESEAMLRATGDKGDLARFVHSLGYVAMHKHDHERAEAQFRESLLMFRKLGNKRGIAECIAGFAGLRARQGSPQIGAKMLGAAETLLYANGAAWWPADRVEVEKTRAILQSSLSEKEFAAEWAAGQGMTLEQAIDFVSNDS
jgi:predicted ATPase